MVPSEVQVRRGLAHLLQRRRARAGPAGVPGPGADTLFELVIDHRGRVETARLLKTYLDRAHHGDMGDHARNLGFRPDTKSRPYRAFFFPTTYDYEFEWP